MDPTIGAHRQDLADGVESCVGSHGHDGDLGIRRLLEGQGFLRGALVDLVQDEVGVLAVEGVVHLGQGAFGSGVRDLFDEYDDVHGRLPSAGAVSGTPGSR